MGVPQLKEDPDYYDNFCTRTLEKCLFGSDNKQLICDLETDISTHDMGPESIRNFIEEYRGRLRTQNRINWNILRPEFSALVLNIENIILRFIIRKGGIDVLYSSIRITVNKFINFIENELKSRETKRQNLPFLRRIKFELYQYIADNKVDLGSDPRFKWYQKIKTEAEKTRLDYKQYEDFRISRSDLSAVKYQGMIQHKYNLCIGEIKVILEELNHYVNVKLASLKLRIPELTMVQEKYSNR